MMKVLAINGSTRRRSANLAVIETMRELSEGRWNMTIDDQIAMLPHFNADNDLEGVEADERVDAFRRSIDAHEGILICTPEYAMGVPGTLKNAIDWTVSTMSFSRKPVALVTASSLGEKGHASMLETLRIIEADVDPACALHLPGIGGKIQEGRVTDLAVRASLIALCDRFSEVMKGS